MAGAHLNDFKAGDFVLLSRKGGAPGVVTNVFQNHCTVFVLDASRSVAIDECSQNHEDIQRDPYYDSHQLGQRVIITGVERKKSMNGLTGVIVAHKTEGHPCFKKESDQAKPQLNFCVQLDDPKSVGSKKSRMLVQPRYLVPASILDGSGTLDKHKLRAVTQGFGCALNAMPSRPDLADDTVIGGCSTGGNATDVIISDDAALLLHHEREERAKQECHAEEERAHKERLASEKCRFAAEEGRKAEEERRGLEERAAEEARKVCEEAARVEADRRAEEDRIEAERRDEALNQLNDMSWYQDILCESLSFFVQSQEERRHDPELAGNFGRYCNITFMEMKRQYAHLAKLGLRESQTDYQLQAHWADLAPAEARLQRTWTDSLLNLF